MNQTRLLACALMLALLSACSSTPTSKAPAELTDFTAEKKVRKAWSASLGDGQGEGLYRITPAIDGDDLIVASADGQVAVLDKLKGKKRWKESYDLRISGGVGVSSGLIFVGTTDGEVVALDRLTGDIAWRTAVGGEVLGAPASDGRVVLVQTYAGDVMALSIEEGKRLWIYNSRPPRLTMRGTSSPVIVGKRALVGLGNGRLMAFEINSGSLLWEQKVSAPQGSTEIERLSDIDGRLRVSDDRTTVTATGFQGDVMVVGIQNGRPLWSREASSFVGVTTGLGRVYVALADGTVTAFSDDGKGVSWTQSVLARRQLTEPAALSGTIAVGDFEGYVHFLSQLDGHLVARTHIDSDGIRAPMLVDGELLYIYANSGDLVALKLLDR